MYEFNGKYIPIIDFIFALRQKCELECLTVTQSLLMHIRVCNR